HALVARPEPTPGRPQSSVTREATTDMANYPKMTIEPTEAALSAIQEALNIRDEEEDHSPAAEPAAEVPADALIVGCLALSWAFLSDLTAAMGPGHSMAAVVVGFGAAALLPIIFFFGVA